MLTKVAKLCLRGRKLRDILIDFMLINLVFLRYNVTVEADALFFEKFGISIPLFYT